MIVRKSTLSGVIAGLLVCLVSLYPILSIYLFPRVLDVPWPPWPAWVRALVLLLNGFVAFIAFLMIGSLAALKSRVTRASLARLLVSSRPDSGC